MKITGAKNNTTNGFLLCFRPFPMGDAANSIIINDDSDLKSFPVIEKPKPKLKSSSSKVHSCDKESIDRNQKKTPRRRFLSKIVKSMAFQSSLSKKVRNGKIIQDPSRTEFRNQKSRRKSSSSSSSEEENGSSISSSISSASSSSLSISSSSSIASSWGTSSSSDSSRSLGSLSGRQKSFRADSIEDEKKQKITSTQSSTDKKKITGICLLLISLFVLIFWGKLFAIICTSTWFYFVSTTRRDGRDNERRMLIKLPVDIPSKEYKKKIIMEGFLERTRNHHRGVFHHHQH